MDRVKRRWWTATTTVLALVVVLAALVSGLFQLAVMALPGYREQLSDYVSRVADRPIDIGGVALVWHRFKPQLELADIVIYGDDGTTPALQAARLRIGFGLLRLLHGDTFPDQIELAGVQVVVQIDRDNKVTLLGIDTAGPAKSRHDWQREVARFDLIRLADCSVRVDDARLSGGKPEFHLVQAQARRRFGGVSIDAQVELPSFMGDSAEFEADLDGDPAELATLDGSWSLSFEQLSRLPWLEARLAGQPAIQLHQADLSVAGELHQGRMDNAALSFEADGIVARRGEHLAKLKDIAFEATARRDAGSWTLEVPRVQLSGETGAWPDTRLRLQWTPLEAGGSELQADADYLRLQDLSPWLALAANDSDARLAAVSGELRSLVARARLGGDQPTYSVRARLDGLGLKPTMTERGPGPGFAGLSGEISATESSGRLVVDSPGFMLDYGRVFAAPVGFEQLGGQLDWVHDATGWRIQMPSFTWQLAGTQGKGDLDLLLPAQAGASPEIKLDARFSAEDAARLKPYAPQFWSENLRNWIDRGIVGGRVPGGRLQLAGKLNEFPFRDNNGLFAVDVDVVNARLAYAPGWPEASQVNAHLEFRGDSLTASADNGVVAGARVRQVKASIPQFKDAVLDIEAQTEGDVAQYYDFLRASPLAPRLSGLLDRSQGQGPAEVAAHLSIPLKDAKQTQIDGHIRLNNDEFRHQSIEEPFTALNGELHFTQSNIESERVDGLFYGLPVVGRVTAEGQGSSRLSASMNVTLQADGSGPSRYVPTLLRPHLSGSAAVTAQVLLGPGSDGVHIDSDLVGVTVDLPPPVGKLAEESVPLRVTLGGSQASVASASPQAADAQQLQQPFRIGIAYQQRLGADVVMRNNGDAMRTDSVLIHLGSDAVPQATLPGVRVTGEVADADITRWLAAMRKSLSDDQAPTVSDAQNASPQQALRLEAIDIAAERLHWSGYSVGRVQLGYRPTGASGSWSATLAGEGAEGGLDWEGGPAPQLIARLRKLKVEGERKKGADAGDADRNEPKGGPLDPNTLPTLDVDCQSCELGESRLGHVRVISERMDGGQRLTTLEAGGAELDFKGSGEWVRRAGASSAYAQFDLTSRSIGPMLEGLGYARNLGAEHSHFKAELTWRPALAGIDWTQAEGRVDLSLEKGTVNAVEPGAGRVLGLLNFYALPRRLTLDFRDVTSKGLGFDKIDGAFELGNGNATTDRVEIDSPSLKIDLKGRIGLAARDYDQRVAVYPDVSGGVTLGALLLGGPALGAIALLAQEVLDKPLDQVTQLSYQVTGSWDNPQVKRAE